MSKLRPKEDLGDLRIVVGTKDDHVIIDFSKEVGWIGMHVEQTEALIDQLKRAIERIRGKDNENNRRNSPEV